MAKGFTYFATDRHGNVHSRYSVGHVRPSYATAAIDRHRDGDITRPVAKDCVRFSANRQGPPALSGRSQALGWLSEIVPVRAYPGRHAVEPVTA